MTSTGNGEHEGVGGRPGALRDALGDAPAPAAALEERVVRSLRARGVLAPPPAGAPGGRGDRWARGAWRAALRPAVGAALAAGLVLGTALGAGWGARGERARAAALAGATAPAPGAPRFALLLYRDPARPEPAGIGHDALVAEYRAWARDVARRGHAVSGEELDERALAVGRLAPSGGEGGPLLVGFFVVSARSAEEAAAIARSCPHLRYGGAVVVRPISAT